MLKRLIMILKIKKMCDCKYTIFGVTNWRFACLLKTAKGQGTVTHLREQRLHDKLFFNDFCKLK